MTLRRSPLLTVHQVAAWLNVSTGWVRDHATGRRRPDIPCVKLGKSLRFREDEVQIWMEQLAKEKAA